jgi:hypothetical protein
MELPSTDLGPHLHTKTGTLSPIPFMNTYTLKTFYEDP